MADPTHLGGRAGGVSRSTPPGQGPAGDPAFEGPPDLSRLATAGFWKELADPGSGRVPLAVVFPSGRSEASTSGHLALISDALYTHEIVDQVGRLAIAAGLAGVDVRSFLDIDFYEEKQSVPRDSTGWESANLLVVATADVNVVAKLLLEEAGPNQDHRVGFRRPYENVLIRGGGGRLYSASGYPGVGVLAAFWNPWARAGRRIVLTCGGPFAVGTLAANRLLLEYLSEPPEGNNRHRPEAPVKVVSASKREYRQIGLLPEDRLVPQHDLRNIDGAFEILE